MKTIYYILLLTMMCGMTMTVWGQPYNEYRTPLMPNDRYGQASAFEPTTPSQLEGNRYQPQIAPIGAESPNCAGYDNYDSSEGEDKEGSGRSQVRRRVDGKPQIPFPDPIGDVPWVLMGILVGTIAIRKTISLIRKQNKAVHD